MWIDLEKIRELAELASDKHLAELTIQEGDNQITLKMPPLPNAAVIPVPYAPHPGQNPQFPPYAPPVAAAMPPNPQPEVSAQDAVQPAAVTAQNSHTVKSPMVATFYASPSPESPPFVAVGQVVSAGQTLCILEAMKQMNELESDVAGKIIAIHGQNGQPVEYGQALFDIEPS
ncbi:MAG: acetyl-CoA carboxylase biotin carboxyl carrier protein [Vampirovibrionales bacterium]|nr:acetyl-CoA carboxylase biotin carboxyl carrier protein [Vampirovibrionales bacterium]